LCRRYAEGDVRDELPVADVIRELSRPKLDGMTAFRPRPVVGLCIQLAIHRV
jgi:hypothetical protein